MSNWIKVEDRLPETGKDVIVTVKKTDNTKFVYMDVLAPDGDWLGYGSHHSCDYKVIAWMLLPTPFKGESE